MRNPTKFFIPAAVAIGLTAAAAIGFARGESAPDLRVAAAWIAATPGKVAAAYLVIESHGGTDAVLQHATSPAAGSVTAHQTKEVDGVATMRPVTRLVVPANGTLVMASGATHLMLGGLAAPLKEGDRVEIRLTFEPGGELRVPIEVGPLGATGPAHSGHSM